jgi:YD repeat-containing protein
MIRQSSTTYTYDALNRLIKAEKEGHQTTFVYDALGRCLSIQDTSGIKQLLYQGKQDIGSLVNGQLQEFRLIHPDPRYDHTFAIELQGQTFFPIQDACANICALQKQDGRLAEWIRKNTNLEQIFHFALKFSLAQKNLIIDNVTHSTRL